MRLGVFNFFMGPAMLAAAFMMMTPPARATDPLLDCTAGTVDQILCEAPELLALHQRMIATVKGALELTASHPEADVIGEQIIGENDGWMASREACLDTVTTTPAECLKDMYVTHIAELEAEWQLIAPTRSPATYVCSGDYILVTFYQSVLPVIALAHGETRTIFVAKPAASGIKYEGPFGQYFWVKGSEALFLRDVSGQAENCVNQEGNRPAVQ